MHSIFLNKPCNRDVPLRFTEHLCPIWNNEVLEVDENLAVCGDIALAMKLRLFQS